MLRHNTTKFGHLDQDKRKECVERYVAYKNACDALQDHVDCGRRNISQMTSKELGEYLQMVVRLREYSEECRRLRTLVRDECILPHDRDDAHERRITDAGQYTNTCRDIVDEVNHHINVTSTSSPKTSTEASPTRPTRTTKSTKKKSKKKKTVTVTKNTTKDDEEDIDSLVAEVNAMAIRTQNAHMETLQRLLEARLLVKNVRFERTGLDITKFANMFFRIQTPDQDVDISDFIGKNRSSLQNGDFDDGLVSVVESLCESRDRHWMSVTIAQSVQAKRHIEIRENFGLLQSLTSFLLTTLLYSAGFRADKMSQTSMSLNWMHELFSDAETYEELWSKLRYDHWFALGYWINKDGLEKAFPFPHGDSSYLRPSTGFRWDFRNDMEHRVLFVNTLLSRGMLFKFIKGAKTDINTASRNVCEESHVALSEFARTDMTTRDVLKFMADVLFVTCFGFTMLEQHEF